MKYHGEATNMLNREAIFERIINSLLLIDGLGAVALLGMSIGHLI
jgi:hypothetical protein